jgi:hypothetical protein
VPHNQGAIGLTTLREDGFVSLYASDSPGWVETPAVRWPGGDLLLNLDARADITSHPRRCTGELRVEVRDHRGKPKPGYTFTECAPLSMNSEGMGRRNQVPVRWQDGKSLAALRGRIVQLAIRMRECHLYSFRAGGKTA